MTGSRVYLSEDSAQTNSNVCAASRAFVVSLVLTGQLSIFFLKQNKLKAVVHFTKMLNMETSGMQSK